jgi:hypothetical protein
MGCLVCNKFRYDANLHDHNTNNFRAIHLGVSSWAHGELGELIAVPVERFSGTFALFEIPTSYGRYWVMEALDSMSPERDFEDDDDE